MERGVLTRRVAQGLFWIGILAIISAIAMGILRLTFPAGIAAAVGLTVLGANVLLAGEIVALAEPRPFSVRGPVVRGRLESHSGLSDLAVGACGTDRVASVIFGPIGKPGFEVVDGVAHLKLNQTLSQPNLTRWQANLAPNVLWDIESSSFIGEHIFDLSTLRIDKLVARSVAGRIKIQCPTKGYAHLDCQTRFGVLEIAIPPEVGAKVTVEKGGLTTLDIRNTRLIRALENSYSTSDYEGAQTRVDLVVQSSAGEIIIT